MTFKKDIEAQKRNVEEQAGVTYMVSSIPQATTKINGFQDWNLASLKNLQAVENQVEGSVST